MLDKEADITKQ